MSLKQEIMQFVSRIQEENNSFRQKIERYEQQIQYVCLKLTVSDWLQFLTDVRTGIITKTCNKQSNHLKKSINSDNCKINSAMNVFNQLFQNLSTQRSKGQKHEYESPIYSQASVKDVRGSDSSRNESLNEFLPNFQRGRQKMDVKAVQKYKMTDSTPKKINNEQSLEKILKYIQVYEAQKCGQLEGFNTFRKVSEISPFENIDKKIINCQAQERSLLNQDTMKKQHKNYNPFMPVKQISFGNSFSIQNKAAELKQNQVMENSDEYILAVQNTKLRRKIKDLQQKMRLKN